MLKLRDLVKIKSTKQFGQIIYKINGPETLYFINIDSSNKYETCLERDLIKAHESSKFLGQSKASPKNTK
ncbi:MAG: hypothetical protein BAJALOKI3v1_50072 [Promethearchaeota archaeon]|nr:MAG: hypothetical protein BAJALOKI3v1_50072 [Candidatus Lokiarchaeota archaeon]